MTPTGRSGANDAEKMKFGTGDEFAEGETDALGEPIGLVEVVEFESLEPAASSPDAYPVDDTSWFRWWYVPAVVTPLAGATAAFMMLRRRRRPAAPAAAYKAAMKQSRDWLDTMRGSRATKSAAKTLAKGAATVRESAKTLPHTAVAIRDRSGEIVGIVVTSAAAKQAARSLREAAETVTSRWNVGTTKRVRHGPFGLFRSREARRSARAKRAVELAIPVVLAERINAARINAARINAARNMGRTTARTNRSTKRARRSVNRAMDRTSAFAFGALVTATVTYARAWRRRQMEREMRETAGGRMVHD